jgi:hypothetical protein
LIITTKSRYNSCRCQGKEERVGNTKMQRYIDTECDGNVPIEDNDDWFIFHHSYILCSYPNVQFSTKNLLYYADITKDTWRYRKRLS